MHKVVSVILILLSINSFGQNNDIFYFAKDGTLLENEHGANSKIERVYISKKKIEINQYQKFGHEWKPIPIKKVATRKKNNFYIIEIYRRDMLWSKNKIEVVDTTESGFVIREYEKKNCQSECEVLSVFPLIYHGECKYFSKDGKSKSSYFYKNFMYKTIAQPKVSNLEEGLFPDNLADQVPQYPKGGNQFYKDLLEKIEFPQNITEEDLIGEFLLSLTIDVNGKITKPHLLKAGELKVSNALLQACGKMDIPWMPAVSDSENVEFDYVFPIVFSQKKKKPADNVLMTADKMPRYSGGEQQLRRDIANRILYPSTAQRNGIQGKVYVSFIVDVDGSIRNIKVARSVHPLLDQEAKRVVKTLLPWIPGEKDGKRVCVSYTVPINFILR